MEEEGATSQDVSLLKTALWNEKGAPEVLQFETELVDRVSQLLKEQQAYIDEAQGSAAELFSVQLYQAFIFYFFIVFFY